MGKAADTGNFADTPSPGETALKEALAGFGAPDASLTNASTTNGHAPEQTAPPPKTVAQVLGEITWLMTQSPRHKAIPLGDLEWLVMPALLLRQFRIFYQGEQPVGVALWALVDDLVAKRIDAGARRIVELVAPFGGEAEMRAQLGAA